MPTRFLLPRRAVVALTLLFVVVAVGIWSVVQLPHATITVYPATFDRTISQDITLSTTIQDPNFVRFILPAKLVDKEIEQTKVVPRSGGTTSEDFAKGSITLHNDQDSEQALLPKTHLRHEATGIFFLTDQAVTVPPKGDVKVSVTAVEKGQTGNVPQGKFIVDKLPASLQKVVYGTSETDFSGGVSINNPLTEDELNQARDSFRKEVQEKARGELTAAAGGAVIRPELVSLEIEDDSSSADVGSKATSFTLHMKVKARGFVVGDSDLLSLTLLALRSSPKPEEEFISYKPDSFKLAITRSDFSRGEALLKGTLTGTFATKTGQAVFDAQNLAGRSQAEVVEYFKQFPSVGHVDVKFSPFWVTTVPSRPSATDIIVKNNQ